jgi:hypothetical protein
MLAIYRSEYGYVDAPNRMTISGLEDELRFAQKTGIETLFYVLRASENRDPRLQSLISEIKIPYTLSFYDSPDELRDRIRDDLTSLVTEKFLHTDDQRSVLREDSNDVLLRALRRTGVIVGRPELVEKLREASHKSPILCLYGPAGIGKTTLAAQFAQAEAAKFLRVTGLAPRDLFTVVAKALKQEPVGETYEYLSLESARMALATAWGEVRAIALVLDECEFVPEFLDALSAGGGTTPDKRLIYTSREPSSLITSFDVPLLTRAEAQEIVERSDMPAQMGPGFVEMRNPLQLQQALLEPVSMPSMRLGCSGAR